MTTATDGSVRDHGLTEKQRDALWKWRWLGLRGSTPAFKASLILAATMLFALVAYAATSLD
jgi:hypothetical protein